MDCFQQFIEEQKELNRNLVDAIKEVADALNSFTNEIKNNFNNKGN